MNEGDEYAIFVRVLGNNKNNKFYNQNYVQIKINRKDDYLVIQNMSIEPETGVLCGDYVDVIVSVRNLGNTDENVIISLNSP